MYNDKPFTFTFNIFTLREQKVEEEGGGGGGLNKKPGK